MVLILALETSSSICSVALFQEQKLLALSELQLEKSHSTHSTVLISQMLENCNLNLCDISAIAISGGPGSYTGLRIGSAITKGLCYSLDVPLIEVSTLHALAYAHIQVIPAAQHYLFCPMLDARRMEVYSCIFNSDLHELFPANPVILTNSTFKEFLIKQSIVFFGSGAVKFQNLLGVNPQALFVTSLPLSAASLGALAYIKFMNQQFENLAYYEPFYMKEVYITSGSKAN